MRSRWLFALIAIPLLASLIAISLLGRSIVSDLEALTVGGLTGGDRIRLEKSGYMLGHGPHTSRTTDLAAGVTVDRVYVQP